MNLFQHESFQTSKFVSKSALRRAEEQSLFLKLSQYMKIMQKPIQKRDTPTSTEVLNGEHSRFSITRCEKMLQSKDSFKQPD